MKKWTSLAASAALALGVTTAIGAAASEPIGTITGSVDGTAMEWRTLAVPAEDTATAEFREFGPDMRLVSIQGHVEGGRIMENVLSFEATLMGSDPMDQTVNYFPDGLSAPFYVSDEEGTEAEIEWTRLEFDGERGHAEGRVRGLLCERESMMAAIDLDSCIRIDAEFSTELRKGQ